MVASWWIVAFLSSGKQKNREKGRWGRDGIWGAEKWSRRRKGGIRGDGECLRHMPNTGICSTITVVQLGCRFCNYSSNPNSYSASHDN